jgi:hypothetical protein
MWQDVRQRLDARVVLPIAAGLVTTAVTVLYWVVISRQGNDDETRPRFVTATLLLAAFALLASTVTPRTSLRLLLVSLGSFTLLIWCILGAFSIGALLLPPLLAGLFAAGEISSRLPRRSAWAAVAGGAALSSLLAGLVLTSS